MVPGGAALNCAVGPPSRSKLSNRMGAAALMPEMPGTGAPSGRPTQTPITVLPSKPMAQASR